MAFIFMLIQDNVLKITSNFNFQMKSLLSYYNKKNPSEMCQTKPKTFVNIIVDSSVLFKA